MALVSWLKDPDHVKASIARKTLGYCPLTASKGKHKRRDHKDE